MNTYQPHFLGATAVTMNFQNAIQVIKDAKAIDPDLLTVMGGPHVSFCAGDTMKAFPELDFIVIGEGEETIVELAEAADNGRQWDRIDGIVFRNNGGVQHTPVKKPCLDVDSLPVPARHLLPLGRYRALNLSVSMTTSRGCPFKCIFCVGRKMVGAKVRYRSTQPVVDELEYLSTLKFSQINIADDLFTANKRHCIDICDEIIRRGLDIKWSSFARVDTVSLEVLKKMKEAGCDTISFGLETANAEILKTIQKGITTDQMVDAIKMCTEAGITPTASFILGLPGETPETLKETVEFGEKIKKLGVIYGFHLLAPFPGTRVRDKSDEYGIKILTNDWSDYHANRAIVETDSVDRQMLDDIALSWEDEIKVWIESLGDRMKKGELSDEEAFPVVNLERTLAVYDMMMKGVLEDMGTWETDHPPESDTAALKELVKRIPDSIGHSKENLFTALQFVMDRENLTYHAENGKIQWKWVDYL